MTKESSTLNKKRDSLADEIAVLETRNKEVTNASVILTQQLRGAKERLQRTEEALDEERRKHEGELSTYKKKIESLLKSTMRDC